MQTTRNAPLPPAAPPIRRGALAAIALATLLASLGTSSANVALPTLATAFDAPFASVQWVVLAYLLTTTTLTVGIGRLGDRFGRRRLLLVGIAVFTAASLAAALAPTLPMLVAARAVQGVGAAAMTVLAMALVGAVTAPSRAGRVMGLIGTTSAAGTALGPSLGGVLLGHCGWPALFLVNVPSGLLTLWLAQRRLPTEPPAHADRHAPFDSAGAATLAVTLGAFALALTHGSSAAAGMRLGLLLATAAGLALFVRIERRAAAPLLPLDMLAAPAIRRGLATSCLVATVLMATLVVGPFHLARGLGLAPVDVGCVMATGPLVAALVGVPAGRLVDRIGAARMARIGFGGITVGAALLALLPTTWGLAAYVVPLLVLTANYALFQAANNVSVLANVAADRRGTMSGMLQMARNLGLILGSAGMGATFALACGDRAPAAAPAEVVAGAMRLTFALATLLLLGAALGASVFGRTSRAAAMLSAQPR